MSLHDRDYMRGNTGERSFFYKLKKGRFSAVNTLIWINVAVFLLLNVLNSSWESVHNGMIPVTEHNLAIQSMLFNFKTSFNGVVEDYRVWTLLTAAFSHMAFWHIAINMYMFWMVSRELETIYGRFEIFAIYVSSAIFSSSIYILYMWASNSPDMPGLGASGVVCTMLVLFAYHFPNRIFLLWFAIPIPAKYFVALLILVNVLGTQKNDNIAYAAHLGGIAFGYLYWSYKIRFSTLLKR